VVRNAPTIRGYIMGRGVRGKGIAKPYGMIGDEELMKAIDGMASENGETDRFPTRAMRFPLVTISYEGWEGSNRLSIQW
jgi:hypothetical protein